MYNSRIKRLLDILLALTIFILVSPVMLIILLVLLFTTGGHPIFMQERAGKNEEPFMLFKFRTMNSVKASDGELASDQVRLTALGRFLRKSSLDELPQLVNVFCGQMSLIGPRPLFMRYLDYYRPIEKKRHSVRPGISGWAQVNGRNNANWDQRLGMDVFYVENVSFKLDVFIIYKTVINIILSRDVVVDETYLIADLNEERHADVVR